MTYGEALKKFLGPQDIEAALDEIGRLAKGANQSIALAGGVAMQLYGSDRLTKDVDVIAYEAIPGMKEIGTLSFGGFKCIDSRGTAIDVIVRGDEYRDLYDDAVLTARPVQGMDILVADVEHIIVMKMQAGRRKDEDDIVSVLRAGTVDVKKTKELVRRFLGRGLVKDLESFMREAEWRREEDEG